LSGLIYSVKKIFELSAVGQRFIGKVDDAMSRTRGLKKWSGQYKKRREGKSQKIMEGILDLSYDVREKYKSSQSMRLEDDNDRNLKMIRSPLRAGDVNTGTVTYESHTGQEIISVVNPLSAAVGEHVALNPNAVAEQKHDKLAKEFEVATVATPAKADPVPVRRNDEDAESGLPAQAFKAAM